MWMKHIHLFSLNLKPLDISLEKFQHFYNYKGNKFSLNLEGEALKQSQNFSDKHTVQGQNGLP